MVKLTRVDDETATSFEKTVPKAQTFDESESDSDSDFDDDFDLEAETFFERIVALKDILPPSQKTQIFKAVDTVQNCVSFALAKGGALLWGVTASALLLGVPLSLAILAETQLQEMEKEMSLQKSAQEVLAPGSESAFSEKSA
ncbi:mitochondrial import translocase, subunit Tom22 [Metschnikowia bicuspidata]|uniref:Mitochondrial import translocase, subunit Tom22 n=1 Tax=Metschnikowia bicuspidata TaxID=27322 RepID=A0A4P9Z8I1_9ASCO|nr:mitochondrial import translocase, subunit Tom22 [Metschnikowia bicuspidata]